MMTKYNVSINLSLSLTVSADYLKRMGLEVSKGPIDMVANSDETRTAFAESVLNQCFRNNDRTLDALVVTDVEEGDRWSL